jgi:hypothetical protein
LTQTSKPTVAFPSGRFSYESTAEFRSMTAIMPGVDSTRTPIVPPTSVTRRSSTANSSTRSMPTFTVASAGRWAAGTVSFKGFGQPRRSAIAYTIPRPPETPSVSPVT